MLEIIKSKTKWHLNQDGSIWILFLLCGLNLIVMHYYIFITCNGDAFNEFVFSLDNLVGVFVDVYVISFISYCLSLRKTKFALMLCFLITWLWSFSNVMYSRFFFHYLSLSAIDQGGALIDDLILQCIMANLHFTDLYYPFVALLFFVLLYNMRRKQIKISMRKVIVCFIILIFADLGVHISNCLSKPGYRYLSYMIHRISAHHLDTHLYYSNPIIAHFVRGEIRIICLEIIHSIQDNKELTEEQLSDIESFSSESRNSISNYVKTSPSANVIFILVESYMSFTSDLKIEGREVTPFLNSLKKDSTVYYNGKMNKNIKLGGSFDGQFIYLTGLLPLRSSLTLSKARHVLLPGLPKVLRRKSRMIIPTVTSMWNQDVMCRQYGVDTLFSRNDYSSDLNANLTDEQVFKLAVQKDKVSSQPFLSIILTISMHQPYLRQIDSTFHVKDPSITEELANYLNVCHYTDRQIEKYFQYLVESGLYYNSVIVIAADHPVDNADFGGVSNDIPLYIINAGISPQNMWHGECNQVDVYTTLLDLLGVECDWYGLGHSLISHNYINSVSSKSWDVAEWIIMGNYFSRK